MKILKKIQLVNWHYFSFETLDFGKINFLTGKNASGKTTIIDAIQLLFLGDTAGHFFNKSASDKSSRTLNGYLRCEIGDDNAGNPVYKRNGRFSNYLAAELYDDRLEDYFTIGCCFDCFDDLTFNAKYFSYNAPLPSSKFLKGKTPVEMKELRAYVFAEFPTSDFSFFETNTSYRDFIKRKFGDIGTNFFSLFKKSIPFAPITNIESFITDYVCDVKNNIDISSMQENIRNYTQLEFEAAILQKRVDSLSNICSLYDDLHTQRTNLALKRYTKFKAEKTMKAKYLDNLNARLDEYSQDLTDQSSLLSACRTKIKELELKREKLITERASSNEFQQKSYLINQEETLKSKIQELENQVEFITRNMLNYKNKWLNTLNNVSSNLRELNNTELSNALLAVKVEFNRLPNTSQELYNITDESLKVLQHAIHTFKDVVSDNYRSYRLEALEYKKQIENYENEINTINSGKKTYDYKLLTLQNLIAEGLSSRYNKTVDVNILADLLEVKHEVWRRPIEAYLGPQRFYLVVDPEYVDEAIAIYDANKVEYNLNEYGIIDTDKIGSLNPNIEKRALSEELTTANKFARKFIDNLLGTLIKCDDVKELRNNRRSITSSGMIYQNFVARQLNLDRITPFLGNNASTSIIRSHESELKTLRKNLNSCYELVASFESANALEIMSTNEINNIVSSVNNCKEVDKYHKDYDDIQFKMKNVGTANYYDHINNSIKEVDLSLTDLKLEEECLVSEIAQNNATIEKLKTNDIPLAKQSLTEITNMMSKEFTDQNLTAEGDALFLEELGIYKSAQNIYNNYSSALELVENQIMNLQNKVMAGRLAYVADYKLDYDATDLSNNIQFHDELVVLRDNRLVEYSEKIKDAKEKAMQQFQDNFMAKLKANFDTVRMQIDNLNYALASSRFGNDSYKFTIAPRNEYAHFYNMINDALLLSGHDIFSEEFKVKYQDTIDELFSLITVVDFMSNDIQRDMEENIAKFTDYRTYLKFDLEVYDLHGHVQRLSKNLLKKSGGETQTPFYISILASFAQLYRIIDEQNQDETKSDTIRLIVFDEAFSKMDSERIQESVKLLRGYGLQAIISAPPEKMPEIVPFVDETLCVIRSAQGSHVTNYRRVKTPV